jgi:tRNA(Ile)-lysidine synthase
MRILNTFRKTIQKYRLLEPGDRVLVAFSGGPDSMALLSLLLEVQPSMSLQLSLAHFNHRLRPGAAADEEFSRQIAEQFRLPIQVGSADVRGFARKAGLNLEEAGRLLRYDFLKRAAVSAGANKIATGHTRNDQAETFLMRLFRGSGRRGLAGIFPALDGLVIRPLLEVERRELESYLKRKRVAFRRDESNSDRRYLRNRIRLELIPFLEKRFGHDVVSRLGRAAAIARDEEDLLEQTTRRKYQKVILVRDGRPSLRAYLLTALPPGLARRVVRQFILELKGNLRGISFQDVESVLHLKEGKELRLKKDLTLRREAGLIFRRVHPAQKIRYHYSWDGSRALEIKELGFAFRGKRLRKNAALDFNNEDRCYLDCGKLRFPLIVRNRQPGDRYRPLGAPGQKKLKEIFRAKGVPPSERDKRPVFLSGGEIVWAPGLPVSENFKVRATTRVIFLIEQIS